MSDAEDTEAFIRFRASGDRKVRNQLVESYRWLAIACAHRFRDRGEPIEDLIQVGMLGLVKAVERFDPANGTPFPGYAVPTITGELRRHFRDTTWSLHVPRRMKELAALVSPASERLRERLKRHPTVAEVAEELRVSVDDVIGAMEASSAYRSSGLHTDRGDGTSRDPGAEDPELERAETREAVTRLLASLPEREQKILYLRFFEEKSQSDIAAVVGTSQVHVSRLIRASLDKMRGQIALDDLLDAKGEVS